MNKYLIFAGDYYYPDGGWNDFQFTSQSLSFATKQCEQYVKKPTLYDKEVRYCWAHIVCLTENKVIKEFRRQL